MAESYQAVSWNGPRETRILERIVEPIGPGELRVEITSVGVCGTDLALWAGSSPEGEPGVVMGHEFGGIIVGIGQDTSGFATGQHVAVDPNVTCGHCRECCDGSRALCVERLLMGLHIDGGFQGHIDIDPRQAISVPGDSDPRSLALVEPLAVAVHACKRAGVRPGMRLGVIGGGAIGTSVVRCAMSAGVEEIDVIEPHKDRRNALQARGLNALASPEGIDSSWDVAVDTVGIRATIDSAITAVRPRSTVCVLGLGGDSPMPPGEALVRREITLTGTFCYDQEDLHQAATLVAENGVAAIPLDIVEGFESVPDVFERLTSGQLGAGKTLLVPRGGQTS